MTTVAKHYGLAAHPLIPLGSLEFYCGCEFEIESIQQVGYELDENPYFSHCEDHSLRNNGREFKTQPATLDKSVELFKKLHSKGMLYLGDDPFSERTSIHVHVNVSNLELTQARQLVLAYALLEPLFFAYVGDVRKNSIYCVPLNYTYLPSLYKHPITTMVEKWHKYTAFNIKPLCQGPDSPGLGTIEFRHMYGTNNVEVFTTWLTAIKQVYQYIATNPEFDIIKAIEAGEDITSLSKAICPIFANMHSQGQRIEMCKDTLLDVKLAVGGLK